MGYTPGDYDGGGAYARLVVNICRPVDGASVPPFAPLILYECIAWRIKNSIRRRSRRQQGDDVRAAPPKRR